MIRLLIADDHALVREGVKRIVEDYQGLSVVSEASNAREVHIALSEHDVDVVLLDVSMPGPGFLETLKRIHARYPHVRILVLSAHPEEQYAVQALRGGADGYLTKDRSVEELETAVKKVHAGGKYITASLAEHLAEVLDQKDDGAPGHHQLSEREYQVFMHLAEGKAIKEIAEMMHLSPKTVSTYRARVLEKLKLDNNAELVRYAARHRLLS